jgi:hypothetical protein
MKHMPTGAFSSVPMTISFSRSDRTFQPSAYVQNRAMEFRTFYGVLQEMGRELGGAASRTW